MDIGREKREIHRLLQETEKNDRISNLPNEVLSQILSLLSTKHAVATSILSSKWKNLYLHVNTLDFDDSLSINSQSFTQFVNRVLARYNKSRITKFRLKCGDHVEYGLVNTWIDVALFSFKVTELDLSIKWSVPFVLRASHSLPQNVEVLRFECSFVHDVRNLMIFRCLKVLFCKEVSFHKNCINGILWGCPTLEELVIVGCDWNRCDLYFSHPFLKKLTLDVGISGALDQLNGCSISFNLPSLLCLKYNYSVAAQYDEINLRSVVNAHLEVCFNEDEFDGDIHLSNTMLDLINGVSNSKYMYLSGQCLEALAGSDQYEPLEFVLPVFRNLTQLKLGQGCGVSWNAVLPDFLKSSPRLETLTLVQAGRYVAGQLCKDFFLGDHPVPSCVSVYMKVLNLENFTGLEEQRDMVVYFLQMANALERMVIHWGRQEKMITETEVLNFAKASKTCLISFK